ncbi:MAG: DNA repair protein RadA, partial [Anaerolineaceae bacterium]
MTKAYTRYVCQICGKVSSQAFGRCPGCDNWDSMVEEIVEPEPSRSARQVHGLSGTSQPRRLVDIEGEKEERVPIEMEEFARVLGGGIVPGSIVLIGGDPGIGKSTLTLQMAMQLADRNVVLYVSGEESERQIKMRATRLAPKNQQDEAILPQKLFLVTETNLSVVFSHVQTVKPTLLVIDSIQTMTLPEMESTAGSISQVRECAARLRELAKTSGIAVFLIGHVTKDGTIAGPRVLEHIVDTVLYLEGEQFQSYRLLRSVKNRFGATSEVGVFEMQEKGMVEVSNPSEVFLAERMINAPGSAIAVTMEGTRPLLVEIQGLTTQTNFGNPRRNANGIDFNRLLLITAVLTRRLGLRLAEQDVFTNV